MADERSISTPGGVSATMTAEDREASNKRAAELKAKFAPLTDEQKKALKAKFAQVMDRGYLNDRFSSVTEHLPEGWHGQWFRDDPVEIARGKMLEYEIARPSEIGNVEGLPHGVGDCFKVGDVVLMICRNEIHELHEETRMEKFGRSFKAFQSQHIQEAEKSLGTAKVEMETSDKKVDVGNVKDN